MHTVNLLMVLTPTRTYNCNLLSPNLPETAHHAFAVLMLALPCVLHFCFYKAYTKLIRFNKKKYLSLLVNRVQAQGAMGGGGWGAGPPQWDAGQVAREQAQRLYSQQMQQAQRHPQQHQQPHMRAGSAMPQDLGVLILHYTRSVFLRRGRT